MKKRKKRHYGYVDHKNHSEERPERLSRRSPRGNTDWQTPAKRLLSALLFLVVLPFVLIKKLIQNRPENSGRLLFKGAVILGIFGFVSLIVLFAWASKDLPDPDKLTDRPIEQSTIIYDSTGEEELFQIFASEKRTLVQLEDIPEHVVNGVIATEDTAFYEHRGIRPLSLLRSIVYGLLGKGRLGGGASTLTQQLVKNAILSPEQTISRKVKEMILSVRLEQKYTKDQILQIYFNEIPYGSTNYGVESAAQSYFGKSVRDVNLQEAAVLAGLPKAPTRYLNDRDAMKLRRDFVLGRMYAEGFITEEEKNAAQDSPLEMETRVSNIKAPHFVMWVKEQLVEQFGEQAVETGGLKVITSLDWEKQQAAETAIEEESAKVFEDANANNTALVAMDPRNGHIVSMVGSRDYFDDEINGQFNVATLGERQPGSSFKPIIFTAAFEKGYTPETVLYDVVTNFAASGRPYQPLNYDLQEHGPVTMRQALQGSLNIPSVKTLYLVGEKEGVDFSERLGYSTLGTGDFGLSLVLGGGEVKLLDHVAAYSVFANQGIKQEPVAILKVEDSNGDVLYEWKQKKGDRVLEKDIAATISNVLSDDGARAYAFGADGILTIPDRPVAAKTGTTNGYVDAWTIGYTPSLVAGVWGGNTNNTAMTRGFGGSRVAAPIWNSFMRNALADSPVETFPELPEMKTDKAVLKGSEGGAITLKVNKVTGKIANSSTPEKMIVERTYVQPHSVLHYVIKDDPQGPIPEDPTADPQYDIWEASIQDWVARKQEENPDWEISFEEPPIDADDEYSLELIPSLEVIFPRPSSTISGRRVDTDIRVSAPRGVKWVKYKLDDKWIGVEYDHPFNLNKEVRGVSDGPHTFTIIVEDDIGNRLEESIPIIFQNDPGPQPADDIVPGEGLE